MPDVVQSFARNLLLNSYYDFGTSKNMIICIQ